MSGVRKEPQANGKYVAWFINKDREQQFFTGTKRKAETKKMAERLEDEHLQMRLNPNLASASAAAKHGSRPFGEVKAEYIAYGESQGGRGGHPWGRTHARERRSKLKWWRERLKLEILSDLNGSLPRVEEELRKLQKAGRSGKTLMNYREAICAFCDWAVKRKYLAEDPLRESKGFDTTPMTMRRAMTIEELRTFLESAPDRRQLLYEVAFTSGLRAGELRALSIDDLDTERGGLRLDAAWTKNRKPGFQPLPASLVSRLAAFIGTGEAKELYQKSYSRPGTKQKDIPEHPLLYVPRDTARIMKVDLAAAGIPKWNPEGKLDFHAARVAYDNFVLRVGASAKEAQSLMRHSTAELTMNTYGRTNSRRLAEVVAAVGEIISPDSEHAVCRTKKAAGAEELDVDTLNDIVLQGTDTDVECGFKSRHPHHDILMANESYPRPLLALLTGNQLNPWGKVENSRPLIQTQPLAYLLSRFYARSVVSGTAHRPMRVSPAA